MPVLGKSVMSRFFRTQCERLAKFELHPMKACSIERQRYGMPDPDLERPAAVAAKRVGDEWEYRKMQELIALMGRDRIRFAVDEHGEMASGNMYETWMLVEAQPGDVIAQGQFHVGGGAFARAHGLDKLARDKELACQDAIPDVMFVLPAGTYTHAARADGTMVPLGEDDQRLQLRIIDIKVTEDPGANYFAEIAYYIMALAGWLQDVELADRFVVVPHGAVWPGSHDVSALKAAYDGGERDQMKLIDAMEPDFKEASFSIFAPRIRDFLRYQVPHLLDADWHELNWHVDNRCLGCEYLGHDWYPTKNRSKTEIEARSMYCMPSAKSTHHLSQIPFMPRGARRAFEERGVFDVKDVAVTADWADIDDPDDDEESNAVAVANEIFAEHLALKTSKGIIGERARALTTDNYRARIAPDTRQSAAMPRWSGLKIYVTATFDVSTAITLSFGVSAFWCREHQVIPPRRVAAALSTDVSAEKQGVDMAPMISDTEVVDFSPEAHDIVESVADLDSDFVAIRRELYEGEESKDWHHWAPATFIVKEHALEEEYIALRDFLIHLDNIIRNPLVQGLDWAGGQPSSYQIYLWDPRTYEHLRRIVGRHLARLEKDGGLEHIYAIFPPEQSMRRGDLASRHSPYTIVKKVVESSLAAPIPHYYSLLNVARCYNMLGSDEFSDRMFRVSPLFDDPLSDHIPSERAHEIWKKTEHWERRLVQLEATVRKHLMAMAQVTERLERDMRTMLTGHAPVVPDIEKLMRPVTEESEDDVESSTDISRDGKIWLSYASLSNSVSSFEVDHIRSMPLFERIARSKSAMLEERLYNEDATDALRYLGLEFKPGRRVYRLHHGSREVSARNAEIDWALAPSNTPGFLDRSVKAWFEGHGIDIPDSIKSLRRRGSWRMEDLTAVSIAALDRTRGYVVLDPMSMVEGQSTLDILEETGMCELATEAVMDPIHVDMFLPKLERAMKRIGNPDIASDYPLADRLNGSDVAPSAVYEGQQMPVCEVLWAAKTMERRGSADVDRMLRDLGKKGVKLNDSQSMAFKKALSRRVHLIWGPPGTGKSHTIGAILIASMMEAVRRNARLRILVTAATWTAIDNILVDLPGKIEKAFTKPRVQISRVRSATSRPPEDDCAQFDLPLTRSRPSPESIALKERLIQYNASSPDASMLEITVVGATAHQVSNIVDFCGHKGEKGVFDLVIIDEGSQMDVATAAVSLLGLARNGSVICAGDWLQLAPIQKAEVPETLKPMLGSIYEFLMRVHGIEQTALEVNHRSNGEIVGFFRQAGYASLRAHSEKMRIRLDRELTAEKPVWWPDEELLPWTPEWNKLVDPEKPLTALLHIDGKSNQASVFEAQACAAISLLLANHMMIGLSGRIGYDGNEMAVGNDRYADDLEKFWREGIGIVTPHRAQQGLVIAEIQKYFPSRYHDVIRGAVDTVERFQGQERDVMLLSFAMGDPDAIGGEAEFLFSLNRFNVIASRPRAKFIALMAHELVDHLANDADVLEESRLLKLFAETPIANRQDIWLPWNDIHEVREVSASMRWHDERIGRIELPRRRTKELEAVEEEGVFTTAPVAQDIGPSAIADLEDDLFAELTGPGML